MKLRTATALGLVALAWACTKEQQAPAEPAPTQQKPVAPVPVPVAAPAPAEPPAPPMKAEPLGAFTPAKLAEARKKGGFEPEDENNLREGREAFLRQMGLEGRKDVRLVGLRRFFKGPVGRQEVGFIAATRADGTALALSVHAVGPTKGVPEAYAGLMAPLDLIALEPVTSGYMKALAAMPNGGFSGEAAGYRLKSEQRGEGTEMIGVIVVSPVVAPEIGEDIPEPPPAPVESACMQRCRARCMATVNQCIAKYGEKTCASALSAVNSQCIPACKGACGN